MRRFLCQQVRVRTIRETVRSRLMGARRTFGEEDCDDRNGKKEKGVTVALNKKGRWSVLTAQIKKEKSMKESHRSERVTRLLREREPI